MNANLTQMALQLSMQDMFSSSWFSNALMSKVWTEMMRSSVTGLIRNTGGADLVGAALGGRLRGDAAMLRQASSNVSEAQSMMHVAAEAVGNIAGQLKEAHKLANEYLALGLDDASMRAALQAQYESISKNIDCIIKSTMYNGIALLDGRAWKGDERLSVIGDATDPAAASAHIQAGDSSFPLTFSNMIPEFFDIVSKSKYALDNDDVLTALSSLQSSAQSLADLYVGRAGSLRSQATSLQSQANILDEAAAQRARTPAPVSPENVLLNLILRDSGSMFSSKG